jgi:hypothetical protein
MVPRAREGWARNGAAVTHACAHEQASEARAGGIGTSGRASGGTA